MAAGSTYTPIATTTLGSTQASVTFSSLSGYTDIYAVINGTGAGQDLWLQFNGDTGSNYSMTFVFGDGSTAGSSRSTSASAIAIGFMATGETTNICQVMNYSNATTYKTTLSRDSRAASAVGARVGLWRNTAAITSIVFKLAGGGNFNSATSFTLYGIAAA
jgi:hypothetical protein